MQKSTIFFMFFIMMEIALDSESSYVPTGGESSNVSTGNEWSNVSTGSQSSYVPTDDEQENVQLVSVNQSKKPQVCGGSLKRLCSTVKCCQLCNKAPPTND
ncbi:uncharacterized protein LOC126838636 [Adelges cooleyi]|uniref:uncharacterized protein LOC126838636 n=1 Tax=Adelges cooleyi TaxID=133065 RepID=UPI0021800236|nr:uncharacterized protein LOC126838636 [Adelges cooleyi]XP_050429183.1 uncharacterized protein LOC126838636 [Adelges cooleyi]